MSFSCCGASMFNEKLQQERKKNILITGIESHVCVLQTCLDLISRGYNTYLVIDAISSRNLLDHQAAIKRLNANGSILTTTETVTFELCRTAERKEFKSISKLIKNK